MAKILAELQFGEKLKNNKGFIKHIRGYGLEDMVMDEQDDEDTRHI